MPWPLKSRLIVRRVRPVPVRGSTVTSTVALIGPSRPWTAQVEGGLYLVTSEVTWRAAGSLVRRLEAAHRRSQELSREIAELRGQLAAAHSDLRAPRR
jgi:hypothetical protein